MHDLRSRLLTLENILRRASPLFLESFSANPGADLGRTKRIGAETKSSRRDLVTFYDKALEDFFHEELLKNFPGENIVGEERVATSKMSAKEICAKMDSFWIIDPIDGTTNFSRAYPFFCSTIAFVEKSKSGVFDVLVGATWDPLRKEMFSAFLGGGAYLNGEKMRVSDVDNPHQALATTGFSYDAGGTHDPSFELFKRMTRATLGVRRDGSAALDLAYVACGRTDLFWELKLAPWDTAAGSLLVMESRGKVSSVQGLNFDLFSGDILSTNTILHKWAVDSIKGSEDESARY